MDVTKIVQPGIDIFGITLMEPVTVVTNLMISGVCFYAFAKLNKQDDGNRVLFYMKYYFLTMGIASTWGGFIGHGFLYLLDESWKLVGWVISMISVALLERSAISHANRFINPKLGKAFLIINIIELLILMSFTISTMHFKYVEFHSAYGFIIVVTSFHLFTYVKTKDKGSLFMIYNTVVLLGAVATFNLPIILHTFFNHRDLAHILMVIASYLIYLGAINLHKHEAKQAVAS
ncbi:MAG: hypothetical protein KI790_10915 [Cyclobacteriaceae bacterium]|nr:hypothetical protein [Cyclobacteriaceae bacterium HetDA_MAG_MS6]